MQNRGKAIHSEQGNGLKHHFGPFLALIGPILGPTKLFQHLKHHQVLDIITPNHDMQDQGKVMDLEQENGQQPHFGPFSALIGPILGPKIFFQHLKYCQVLDVITSNHDMQNRGKAMHLEQENGLKSHLGPFLALVGP